MGWIFRKLVTLIGIVFVFGIGVIIFKPDFLNMVLTKPVHVEKKSDNLTIVDFNLSTMNGTLIPKQRNSFDKFKEEFLNSAVSIISSGVPSISSGYLLMINTNKHELRFWSLSSLVKNVQITQKIGSDVRFEVMSNRYLPEGNQPFQAVLWVSRDTDIPLEFTMALPEK